MLIELNVVPKQFQAGYKSAINWRKSSNGMNKIPFTYSPLNLPCCQSAADTRLLSSLNALTEKPYMHPRRDMEHYLEL